MALRPFFIIGFDAQPETTLPDRKGEKGKLILNNMIDIDKLIGICKDLKLEEETSDLSYIKSRMEDGNKEIFIPLVGEFSSGKTSLINALTDSKELETASKPTTSTIYEIHFGYDHCYANVIDENNNMTEIQNIADLKNDNLIDSKIVKVFDTSKQVPATTVLVDTPGLSSNEEKHKIALSSYLPYADAILLVVDINQQVTKSLIDFVENSKITNNPIYLIITKTDTKTSEEVKEAKKYVEGNIKLPLENIVCVSAEKGDLSELYMLLGKIQAQKNTIVTRSLESKIKGIADSVNEYVTKLIESSSSNSESDSTIKDQERILERTKSNIDRLIRDASSKINEIGEDSVSLFKKSAFEQLDSIVVSSGRDCDNAVYSAVNQLATLTLSNYKRDVQAALIKLARERQHSLDAVPLQMLESLDMSSVTMNPFTYNLHLSEVGHERDQLFGTIVKGAAVVALIAATAGAAAPAAAGAGAVAETGVTLGTATAVGDVALDAYQAQKLAKQAQQMSRMTELCNKINHYQQLGNKALATVNKADQSVPLLPTTGGVPSQQGFINTSVSWVTEQWEGKPQRRKAVSNYVESSLIPEYRSAMMRVCSNLTTLIKDLIEDEAENSSNQIKTALEEMKKKRETEKSVYEAEMLKLKEYKSMLN
jgi:small GTP-binding protein